MRSDSNERSLLERGGIAALVGGLHVMMGAALLVSGVVSVPKIHEALKVQIIDAKPAVQPVPLPPTAAQTTLASVKPENPLIPPVSIEPEAPIDVAVPDQGSSPSLPEYHGPSMAAAHVLRSSAPDYPDYEIMQGHAGVVELRILIGTDGHARDVELAKTSGYPNLDKAALSAVRRWVFEAARRDGATIETWATLKVRFDLR